MQDLTHNWSNAVGDFQKLDVETMNKQVASTTCCFWPPFAPQRRQMPPAEEKENETEVPSIQKPLDDMKVVQASSFGLCHAKPCITEVSWNLLVA